MNREQAKRLIISTFENPFNKELFSNFIANLLKTYDRGKALDQRAGIQGVTERFLGFISSWERLGRYIDEEGNKIDILIVKLKKDVSLYRARSTQRNFVAYYLQGKLGTATEKDAALVAFVSPDEQDWRFSLVKVEYELKKTPTGKTKVEEEFTPAKRWSFLVGPNEKSHTAQSRFLPILENDDFKPKLSDLEKVFDVEVVTEEFFEKYRDLFIRTKLELDKIVNSDEKVREEFRRKNISTIDFAKKLLGQIVFLYFLQKKGWFGVEREKPWGTGPKDFLRRLFNKEYGDYKNFYNDILEPLFYEALRTDRAANGHYYYRFKCKIPFLNGGLFDPPNNFDWVNVDLLLPNELFSNKNRTKEGDIGDGILDIFDRYNFTVNEEEDLEKEVALDPELLGKIYEKLNAIREDNFDEYIEVLRSGKKGEETKFNKEYGVYYTPREIVRYMCQESLIDYLETELNGKVKREDIENFVKFGDLFLEHERVAVEKREKIEKGEIKGTKYEHEIPESIVENAETIYKLLDEIKICDPAVGSGAFPIGMLHEIVKLKQILSVYLGKDVNTYDLKRYVIENSLYGVDIDPGAVEICKLRFWLSLIVDEEDFHNIKPLPNLDYKVVCGDSLGRIEIDLYNQEAFNKLESLKEKYFNEANSLKRQELKKEIDDLIFQITKGHKEFDFKVYFSEVFRKKGGFDIVIGNPPYVKDERITHLKPQLQKNFKEFFDSTFDLYVYFYRKSYDILRGKGILCFISSNKWMRAKYGKKLRKFLKENTTILKLIDFSGYRVFAQTVDTNIILFRKQKPQKDHIFEFTEVKSDVDNVVYYIKSNSNTMLQEKLSDNTWTLGDDRVLALKEKIEKIGKPLKDWNVKIYRGVLTGYNDAFIIDTETRNRILANCKTEEERKRTEEIMKPVLRGRDIEKYYYKWAGLWVIIIPAGWTNNHRGRENPEEFFKKTFPALYKHFMNFSNVKTRGKGLFDRDDQGDYWWELRHCDYYSEFEKEKIVWQEIVREPSFAYDNTGIYVEATGFLMTGRNLKYLLGLLNSNPVAFFFKTFYAGGGLGEDGYRYKKAFLEQLPLPPITKENQPLADQIVQKVQEILSLTQSPDYGTNKEKQQKVKELEKEIDELVYKLYNLTEEEIKIIEGEQ
jgi:hypothetical protein